MSYKFGLVPPHPCPYIPGNEAQNIVLWPDEVIDTSVASHLNLNGFRRSGDHLYRPHCGDCNACESTRIQVANYQLNRASKRCLKRNQPLRIEWSSNFDAEAFYPLYEQYITQRHADGDMYPPSYTTFEAFLGPIFAFNCYLSIYDDKELIGVMVYDRLEDGLSAVYSFFDATRAELGLGRLLILKLIELAETLQLPHLYLGYAVDQCQKMQYKGDHHPQERFINGKWQLIPK
ncbi:arginyltransferase [Umboniibacter marinipuniceus]|uniref:Aspartate/glutamate leucyltransferase n=1 Tax=Umboniibacter marinipuniceus TaxID=569599 RepID=A0A3M0A9H3_9GAMM|nr:arginyltransferase [Umboniibacter marinipuniceus]RMA81266.1 arginine-tRNA-protein transferase [Umboniibacter marinipuniceus]